MSGSEILSTQLPQFVSILIWINIWFISSWTLLTSRLYQILDRIPTWTSDDGTDLVQYLIISWFSFVKHKRTFTELIGAKSWTSIIIREIFQNCWYNISSILHLDDLNNDNYFNLRSASLPSPSSLLVVPTWGGRVTSLIKLSTEQCPTPFFVNSPQLIEIVFIKFISGDICVRCIEW